MGQKERIIAGVSANILMLGIVSFFTDVSTESITAVLPTYLVLVLGVSPVIVGGIEGAAESTTSFLRLFSGALADKYGKRKNLTAIGYTISNVAKPLIAFASSWEQILGLRLIDRGGKGVRTPPRDALIADSADEKRMGRAFGIHRTLDQLGAVVGPLISYLLLVPLGYKGIFLLTAVPGAIAVLVLLAFVKEPPRKKAITKYSLKNARSILDRPFSFYLGSATFYAISAFTYAFILLRAVDLGITPILIPLLYAAMQVAYVLMSIPSGDISDRFGRVRAVQLGYLFLLVSMLILAWAPSAFILVVGALIWGAHQGVIDTSQRAIIPSLVQDEMRGTAYGLYNMMIGIVVFPTDVIAGYLFSVNNAYAFYYGAAFAVIASVAMALTQREMAKRKKNTGSP